MLVDRLPNKYVPSLFFVKACGCMCVGGGGELGGSGVVGRGEGLERYLICTNDRVCRLRNSTYDCLTDSLQESHALSENM